MKTAIYRIVLFILRDFLKTHPELKTEEGLREAVENTRVLVTGQADEAPGAQAQDQAAGVPTKSRAPLAGKLLNVLLTGLLTFHLFQSHTQPPPPPGPPPVVKPAPEPTPTPSPVPVPVPAPTPGLSDALVHQANAYRAEAGLAPLAVNPRLTELSQSWATSMARTGYLGHGTHEEYLARTRPYGSVGEIVARGIDTPQKAVELWIKSPPHRAILMDPHARTAGGARSSDSWCMDFGQ